MLEVFFCELFKEATKVVHQTGQSWLLHLQAPHNRITQKNEILILICVNFRFDLEADSKSRIKEAITLYINLKTQIWD